MKIGDVKIGSEYGLLYSPSGANYGTRALPRQVLALAIEAVPEKRWVRGAFRQLKEVNVKRVRVRFLDGPLMKSSYHNDDAFLVAAKDSERVVEARQLAGLWKDLRSDVAKELKRRAYEVEARASIVARLKALKINPDHVAITVNVHPNGNSARFDLRLRDPQAEKLLALAEKGAQT
jgi:hypothetical protein